MTYLIKWDFSKFRPDWGKQLRDDFGERNEGVKVEAQSAKHAVEVFNSSRLPGDRYNGFYLYVREVLP